VLRFGPHEVVARSGHRPDSLRGHEATHIVVDEAAFVHPRLVSDALWPMLATTDGQMTLISTPNGFNHFQRMFEWARQRVGEAWAKSAPSRENPEVTEEFLSVQRELHSERTYEAEYEAKFLQGEGAVFREEAILNCLIAQAPEDGTMPEIVRQDMFGEGVGCSVLGVRGGLPSAGNPNTEHLAPNTFPHPGIVFDPNLHFSIGIDWGRSVDWTAVVVLCGTSDMAWILECRRIQTLGYVAQAEILKPLLARYPTARVTTDFTGVGDAATSILQATVPGRGLTQFKFNQESRRQLVETLVSQVERGALKFRPDAQLLQEMRAFRWKNGRAEGDGEHDDMLMALGMALLHLPRSYGSGVKVGAPRGI
jgi:hypothetical protein